MLKIWSYWEGPKPAHIETCLASIARVCGDRFQLVDRGNVGQFLQPEDLPACWSSLREPAHRADILRAALLYRHGGLYLDADTVMLRDPSAELAAWEQFDLVYTAWRNPPRRVLNGYIFAKPGSLAAAAWHNAVIGIMNSPTAPRRPAWTALGEGVLTPLVESGWFKTLHVRRSTFLPIDVDADLRLFFQGGDPAEHIRHDSICFGLNHSAMWARHRNVMLNLDRCPDLLISRLMGLALPQAVAQ